ncbi:MAG: hypothetical protein IT364_19415 [Candidatus Hydrogenedentes bacterium]|nr:hypothetical protein [Candidatus Hydrogenedentota bacterium]
MKFRDPIEGNRARIIEDGLDTPARPLAMPLPRGLGDRVLLGAMSIMLLLFSAGAVYMLRTGEEPANRVLRFVLLDVASLVLSLSALSLLWAIAMPRFIERMLVQRAFLVAVIAFIASIGLVVCMFYM